MKTNELTGDALLWAVAVCMGYTDLHRIPDRMPHEPQLAMMPPRRDYGAMELWEIGSDCDWGWFGPIIEREKIATRYDHDEQEWQATFPDMDGWVYGWGTTPLIAAMRCYVTSKLGDNIELPEELK